jgi:hypothetical protein
MFKAAGDKPALDLDLGSLFDAAKLPRPAIFKRSSNLTGFQRYVEIRRKSYGEEHLDASWQQVTSVMAHQWRETGEMTMKRRSSAAITSGTSVN